MERKNIDALLVKVWKPDIEQIYKAARLIQKYKPEVVLYAGFYSEKEDPSLQRICEEHGISPEEAGFTEKALNKEKFKEQLLKTLMYASSDKIGERWYRYCTLKDLAYLPVYAGTYEKIINTPLAAYNPGILRYLSEIVKNKKEEIGEDVCKDIVNTIDSAERVSRSFREKLLDMRPIDCIIAAAAKEVGAKMEYCFVEEIKEYLKEDIPVNCIINMDKDAFINLRKKLIANSIERYVNERQTNSPIMIIVEDVKNIAEPLEGIGIKYKVIELKRSIEDPELLNYATERYAVYQKSLKFIQGVYYLGFTVYKYKDLLRLFSN